MKKKMVKKPMILLLGVSMVVSILSGCGSSDSSKKSASTPEELSGTIVLGGWPAGDEAFKSIQKGFETKYPNVKLKYQFASTADYTQALQTSLAAGTGAPDVAMVEGASMGKYKEGAGLENLYDSPYDAKSMKDDFVKMKWDLGISADEKGLYGIPWDIGPTTYFYRKDIFKEAGLPSEPDEVYKLMSTYDGILEVAKKVYIKDKRWLLPNALYLYTWNFINRDYYNENLELQLDRKGAIEGLNAAIKMRQNGWDAKTTDMWTNEANAGLANGSILSVAAGAWYGGFLKSWVSKDNSGKWGVTRLPAGIADSNWGGSYLTVPSQSKNKEAAWAFIKYALANPDSQNTMFKAVDYFPAFTPAWKDTAIYEAADPYFDGQKTKSLWVDIAKNIKPVFSTLMDSDTEAAITTTVNTGLNENKSATEIVNKVKKAVSDATSEDREKNIDILKDAGKWKGTN